MLCLLLSSVWFQCDVVCHVLLVLLEMLDDVFSLVQAAVRGILQRILIDIHANDPQLLVRWVILGSCIAGLDMAPAIILAVPSTD